MSEPPGPRGPEASAYLDDHLGLLRRSLADRRLVLFTGMSGSGKSSYLALLVHRHPDFRKRPYDWIGPTPIDWSAVAPTEKLVLVDEIQRPRELVGVARLLRRGHVVIAASHLSPAWARLLALRWPTAAFRTDRADKKLEAYLRRRGFTFSSAGLRRFTRKYGANYVDLEIVLETASSNDFDAVFDHFDRTRTIELSPST